MPSKVEAMRDTLLQAIQDVKSGAMTPEKAKAIAALAHQVNASLDVELRVMLAIKSTPRADSLVADSQAALPRTTDTEKSTDFKFETDTEPVETELEPAKRFFWPSVPDRSNA